MSNKHKNFIWKVISEKFKLVVSKNKTIKDILLCFGLVPKGRNHLTIHSKVKEENVDISHIQKNIKDNKKMFLAHQKNTIPIGNILVENSKYRTSRLKKRLIKEDLLKDKCNVCGQEPIWNGKFLVLELDHINGQPTDNRLVNLQVICGHCHSQTETFREKKRRCHT